MKKNSSYSLFFYKMNGYFIGNFKNSKLKYLKSSIIALILGFFISSIFIIFSNANPFSYFYWTFKIALDPLFLSSTIIIIALYILASISLSIGFKCKIFNIGIAGQMMLSGAIILIMGIKNPNLSEFEVIFYGLIISILCGSFLALFSAILKALFNVHEVVTTIMTNWIVFYFLRWLFMSKGVSLGIWDSVNNISTTITNPNFTLSFGNNIWIFPFLISIVLLFLTSFIFYKTRFGFKTILIGENDKTAIYSGIKSKYVFIIIMMFQGAVAGILGMIYYMDFSHNIISFSTNTYPLFGFNAFSISLIAFNNPIGIFFISILWGILDSGCLPASQLPQFHISKEISSFIYGIVIYFAAIYTLFFNSNIILLTNIFYVNKKYYKIDNKQYKNKLYEFKKNYNKFQKIVKRKYKSEINSLKKLYKNNKISKNEYWIKINLMQTDKKNKNNIVLQNKIFIKEEYKFKCKKNYDDHLNSGKWKIKRNFKNNKKTELFKLLNDSVALEYKYQMQLLKINQNNKQYKNKLYEFKKNYNKTKETNNKKNESEINSLKKLYKNNNNIKKQNKKTLKIDIYELILNYRNYKKELKINYYKNMKIIKKGIK